MKLEPEQRNQFIALCCLVVLVLGFGIYRIVGVRTNAGSAPGAGKSVERSISTPVTDANAQEQDGAGTMLAALPIRDPFQPQVLTKPQSPSATTKTGPPRMLPLIAREPRISLPMMPPFGGEPMNVRPMPLPVVEDPSKELTVTGVIEGEANLAVIRAGDKRHIVREGQSIDGKYVVTSISRTGVRIARNGKSYFLALSGGKSG